MYYEDEYEDYDDYEDICPNCLHHWENCWCDPDTIAPYTRLFPDEVSRPSPLDINEILGAFEGDDKPDYYESGAYYDDYPF